MRFRLHQANVVRCGGGLHFVAARALINQTSSPVSPQTILGNGSQADAQTNQVNGNACVQLAPPHLCLFMQALLQQNQLCTALEEEVLIHFLPSTMVYHSILMKYSQQALHNKEQRGGAENKVRPYFSMHDPENTKRFTNRVRSCIPYSELQSLTHAFVCPEYM